MRLRRRGGRQRATFENPDLVVVCVNGDEEAETGPLVTAWHSTKFLNPARDGAILPILHLNGYTIANPTIVRLKGRFYGRFMHSSQMPYSIELSSDGATCFLQHRQVTDSRRRVGHRGGGMISILVLQSRNPFARSIFATPHPR
ncbi:fructose-6-phosphate phosphoketolase (plasmid) [Rhizobium favelukesii]|uniref:Fructose-6-phosphate phosphoketolase n=1 Tax=Rhizobium favelukesii TaxID=348824 RepID=W6RM90_9HYPH|nr:fructose-6-phosphate phosphoketolase [Rhizobium favelukesii]